MSADHHALAAMRKDSAKSSGRCVVGAAADALDAKQRATFNEAMWGEASKDITGAAIGDFVRNEWGWNMHVTTIRVHRRGGCTCDDT